MSFDPLSAAFDLGKVAIEKIWPDPTKRSEEMRKLEELRQTGDLAQLNAHVQLMLAQLDVNKAEAQHKSIFVAGWRPWIGWVGGSSLAYAGVIYPLLTWAWAILQAKGIIPPDIPNPPYVESATLTAVVTAMLGVGGMRSYDKTKGTHTDSISQ